MRGSRMGILGTLFFVALLQPTAEGSGDEPPGGEGLRRSSRLRTPAKVFEPEVTATRPIRTSAPRARGGPRKEKPTLRGSDKLAKALDLEEPGEVYEEKRRGKSEFKQSYSGYTEEMLRTMPNPPPPPKPTTFEEDLAVVEDAEKRLRAACEAKDLEEAKRLIQCGATFDYWECSSGTAQTVWDAQDQVWKEEKRQEEESECSDHEERGVSSEECRTQIEILQKSMNLTEAQIAGDRQSVPIFLSSQVTKEHDYTLPGYSKREVLDHIEETKEIFRKEHFPGFKGILEDSSSEDIASFRAGFEEMDEIREERKEEIEFVQRFPEYKGWVNPFSKRMERIEYAIERNAIDELDSDEKDLAPCFTNPAEELQNLMSASESESEPGEVLRIKKKTTEITQAELDPFDKHASGRLSKSFNEKEFDLVDNLDGFERLSSMYGVRGSDQSYNQVRTRFLNAQTGSYKQRRKR